jgi:hypothetical protein
MFPARIRLEASESARKAGAPVVPFSSRAEVDAVDGRFDSHPSM